MKQLDDLSEDSVKTLFQTFAAVIVDCPKVGALHSGKPHEIDIPSEKFLDSPG